MKNEDVMRFSTVEIFFKGAFLFLFLYHKNVCNFSLIQKSIKVMQT